MIIRDHGIKLFYDDSAVVKGIKRTTERLKKSFKTSSKRTVIKQENEDLKQQLRLLRARRRLLDTANRAKRLGVDPLKLGTFYSSAKRGKDVIKLNMQQEKLMGLITEQREQQYKLSKMEGKERLKFLDAESARVRSMKNRIENALFEIGRQEDKIRLSKSAYKSEDGQTLLKSLQSKRQVLSEHLSALSGGITLKALHDIEDTYRNMQRQVKAVKPEVTDLTRRLTAQEYAARSLRRSLYNLSSSYLSIFAVIAGASGMYKIGENLESIQASLLAGSDGAKGAAKNWAFITKTAINLGSSLTALAKGYQQISTSTKDIFSEAETKNIFLAAAEGAKAYGLSVEDTNGVMRAFAQIASKGSVQAEELRGQLGDRLYGAFQLAAESLGITTDELNKMLRRGELASKDMLPKFADELRRVVRETGALDAALQSVRSSRFRLGAVFQLATDKAFKKAGAGIKKFFDSLSKLMLESTDIFESFGTTLGGFLAILSEGVHAAVPALKKLGELLKEVFEFLSLDTSAQLQAQSIGELSKAAKILSFVLYSLSAAWYYLLGALTGEQDSIERVKKAFDDMFGDALAEAKDFYNKLKDILDTMHGISEWYNSRKGTETGLFGFSWPDEKNKIGNSILTDAALNPFRFIRDVSLVVEQINVNGDSTARQVAEDVRIGLEDGIAAAGDAR